MKSRKELKTAYREHKSTMGVFQIKNLTNGKVWIEGSKDMAARWNRHQTELRFGSHRNKELQEDWNAKGADQFEFTILSELEYSDVPNVNYTEEVKELAKMVLEELSLDQSNLY